MKPFQAFIDKHTSIKLHFSWKQNRDTLQISLLWSFDELVAHSRSIPTYSTFLFSMAKVVLFPWKKTMVATLNKIVFLSVSNDYFCVYQNKLLNKNQYPVI